MHTLRGIEVCLKILIKKWLPKVYTPKLQRVNHIGHIGRYRDSLFGINDGITGNIGIGDIVKIAHSHCQGNAIIGLVGFLRICISWINFRNSFLGYITPLSRSSRFEIRPVIDFRGHCNGTISLNLGILIGLAIPNSGGGIVVVNHDGE